MKTIAQIFRVLLAPLFSVAFILLVPYIPQFDVFTSSRAGMNLLFLFPFLVNIALTVQENENRKKISWTTGSLLSSLISIFYNAVDAGIPLPFSTPVEFFSSFTGGWLTVCLILLAYFLVLCVRIWQYTEDDWRKEKAFLDNEKQSDRVALQQERQKQREHQETLNEQIRMQQIRKAKKNQDPEREVEMPVSRLYGSGALWSKFFSMLCALLLMGMCVYCFLFLPSHEEGRAVIKEWFEGVNSLLEAGGEIQKKSILEYSILIFSSGTMVVFAGMFIVVLFRKILSSLFFDKDFPHMGLLPFFSKYTTSFSIFIVAYSVVTALSSDGISESNPGGIPIEALIVFFQTLSTTVLYILLSMIAIDAVRLALDQCLSKGSLLSTSMRLTFMLLIDRMMGIILGVLTEINPQAIIEDAATSVASLFISDFAPDSDDISDKVKTTMDSAMDAEIHAIKSQVQGSSMDENEERFNSWNSNAVRFYKGGWSKETKQ